MARWLLLAMAVVLARSPGANAGRYADYSAARMPQYDSVNYDAQVASSADEGYRDRPDDFPVPIDYNYEQTNDKRNLNEERDNSGKESTIAVTDYEDTDYTNEKMEDTFVRNKYHEKNRRNHIKSKITGNKIFAPRSKLQRYTNNYEQTALDDQEVEVSSEQGKDLDTDSEKSKFVRRDVSQNVRGKSWDGRGGSRLSNDYGDQSDYRQVKGAMKPDGPRYPDAESPLRRQGDGRPYRLPGRPPAYPAASEDTDQSQISEHQLPVRYKAPMPNYKKVSNDYVDYNDKGRIEKIKNLSASRSSVRPSAMRRWSFQDDFRRRNQGASSASPGELEHRASTASTSHTTDTTVTAAVSTTTQAPLSTTEIIAPLPKDVIQNITAFLNKTKQLSLAEKSQLSILKKAQRKDSVKDDMLKNKPPVLLQVTENMQTVVMVEPPVSQEPWLRARDIAEDSPERIEKVKRFMRNKLVANARNISELMDNWDDTVCDYIDITMLDENGAPCTHTSSFNRSMFIAWFCGVYLCTKRLIHNL